MNPKAHPERLPLHPGTSSHRKTTYATLALALLATTGFYGAISPEQTAAGPAQVVHENGVDSDIKPGDDFFAYANGSWLKATEIPAGRNRWGVRDEIDEKTRQQLSAMIEEAAARPVGSYQDMVAVFYTAYLGESVIEAKGLTPIKPLLKRVDGVHDKAALTRVLGSGLRADVDPLNLGIYTSSHLFGLSVEFGIHGEKNHFAYLLQGGLGLPDRDYYLNASSDMQALRVRYQNYIGRTLELAAFDRAAQRAEAVMALEIAIARSHVTREESANDRNADNHWTRADFSSKAPGVDWSAFFTAAQLSKQTDFVVWQPGAIAGEAALVASHPLDAWKDYLRFHLIDRYADLLPRAFDEQAFALHAAGVSGTPTQIPRAQRARDATSQALPEAVGRMYVEKYFSAQTKARVQAIVDNVIAAFGKRIEALPWMAPDTKIQALSKLKAMYFGVGYPETWSDYSRLSFDARDAIGNRQRIADWNYRNALARLDQPTDISDWVIPPQMVGAIFNPLKNSYNFSAALLQATKFDATASDAANYGAIGAIAGHEVSHFVDTLGADYDADGGMRHWWTNVDKVQFDALSETLVRQFSGYHPFPDLAINGKLTLSENIADLGGLAAAFDAYRQSLGSKASDKDYVRQQDREFFIGFARAWRVKAREDAIRTQVASNIHAPENYRIATVRNMDAWYAAFDVRPGQRLYLEPQERVRIW